MSNSLFIIGMVIYQIIAHIILKERFNPFITWKEHFKKDIKTIIPVTLVILVFQIFIFSVYLFDKSSD